MDEPVYVLQVRLANHHHEVYGPRGPFMDVLARFEAKEWDEAEKIRIRGHKNTFDRAEQIVVARLDRIDSMDLVMM